MVINVYQLKREKLDNYRYGTQDQTSVAQVLYTTTRVKHTHTHTHYFYNALQLG